MVSLSRHRGNGSSPRQRVPMESEPDASDFSSESSSSFEFSLSNSVYSDEEELVSVDSTIEPYQFETVGAGTSHASDSDGDDGKPGKGRLSQSASVHAVSLYGRF